MYWTTTANNATNFILNREKLWTKLQMRQRKVFAGTNSLWANY